jgi:hypothetical protein
MLGVQGFKKTRNLHALLCGIETKSQSHILVRFGGYEMRMRQFG